MCFAIQLRYDLTVMRAISFAAVIVLLAASSAYAQGQSSTSMSVSVRVIRSCNVAAPGSTTPVVTAQCASAAAPRTQLAPPAPGPGTASTTLSEPRAGAFRVLTVNF